MSKVITHMTMSLDGFVADPQDGVEAGIAQAQSIAGDKTVCISPATAQPTCVTRSPGE